MAAPYVDPDLCTGCGVCESICPEVFELGDDGIAHVIDEDACDSAGCCDEAIDSCPEEAISMRD
ncbi:MAG: ferredoxin [Thermoleophilia bacterium]